MDNTDIQFFLMVQPSGDRKPTYANNDVAMACPICNEGRSLGRKQRCHLYKQKDSVLVHCFNCDWHSNLYNFLKMADESVCHQYKVEKRGSFLRELEQEASQTLESKDIQEKRKENELLTFKFSDLPFTPITDSKWGMSYLYKRKIHPKDFKDFFFVGTESLDLQIKGENKKIAFTPGIIVPLWYDRQEGLCYGFQYRSLESKRFFTYLPEENQNYKVYNFFGSKNEVYVFESVFDLYSNDIPLENKIASLGSDINDDIIQKYKKVTFCLDNQNFDETSKKKLEKYSLKGYNIFVWNETIKQKDFNELLQGIHDKLENPYTVITKMIEKGIQTPLIGSLKMKLQGLVGL